MSRLKGALADPLLSVVMPVYNERATIEEIIRRVLAVPIRIELIVVDDGSKDGTRDILSQLAADAAVQAGAAAANGGKGAALRRGFPGGDAAISSSSRMPISSTRRRSSRS